MSGSCEAQLEFWKRVVASQTAATPDHEREHAADQVIYYQHEVEYYRRRQ